MSFTESLYFILFLSGLTGGLGHCVGMCGPIVVSLSMSATRGSRGVSLLLYHVGRVTTYAILGGVMGLAGSFTKVAVEVAFFQKGLIIATGVMIAVMGAAQGGWLTFGAGKNEYGNRGGIFSRMMDHVRKERSPGTFFPLGLMLGFLPCGLVYTALLAAAGSGMEVPGSPRGFLSGFGLMLAFGAGTVPSLYVVGRAADFGLVKSREVMFRASSVLMIIVGVLFIVRGVLL